MVKLQLDHRNIIFGLEADSRDGCIRNIVDVMARNGYVGTDYADHVIARENKYPTGLPTEGAVTAIPHAAQGTVYRTGMALAILAKPVYFHNMADPSQRLPVEIVCVLANVDPDQQLSDLRRLMACFSEEERLLALRAATRPEQVAEILAAAED